MRYIRMSDIMNRSFKTVKPEDNLKKVARLLRQTRLDGLPVIDDSGVLVGIMTKANFYDAVADGLSPEEKIHELYTKKVVYLYETDSASYDMLAEGVKASPISCGVVVNNKKGVVGLITKSGWIKAMREEETFVNDQLMAMLQNMHNGLVAVSIEGVVNSLNRAAEKILNTSADLCVGKPVSDLLPNLNLENVFLNGEASIGIKHSQGKLSLLCNINPIVINSKITGANIVFQDLTDLNRLVFELESVTKHYETLHSVMEIAYDGLIVVDEKSNISMVNRAAAKFFRKREEDMVGKPVEDVIENTKLHKVVQTGVPEISQLQFIGGTPYVVSSIPVMRKGVIIGAVGKIMFRNLKEAKDLAEKLANMDQQLAYYKRKALQEKDSKNDFEQIITADPVFQRIKEDAEIVARGTSNILITGQSGTGKELIAQSIHQASYCSNGPMVKVNSAAIPESLLESEFFGYAPGAFTGAKRGGKKGTLTAADGGTLFLDEIGDMSFSLQGKLLRVIQDGTFEPIGSNKPVRVNVRFIAATNHELKRLVQEGRFRSDLYYRLNVIHFQIPPLNERRHDIILLVNYFLKKYNQIFGTSIEGITHEVQRAFIEHEWPGNVRELENVIERAINFARGSKVEIKDLPLYLRESKQNAEFVQGPVSSRQILRASRETHEKESIEAALNQVGGNKAAAARILGISRSWLYEKMSKLNIKYEK